MVRAMLRPVASHAAVVLLALAAVLAGCSSTPKPPPGRDGPMAETPADLHKTPDAEPRVEPIRPGGPNKPYAVNGRSYTPETRDVAARETGLASWYGRKFHGRRTASGEVYNMYAMTAAHTTLPVLGVPVQSAALNGLDSLLSIVQMPGGVPVATLAIGKAGATNAGLLAVSILALSNGDLSAKLRAFRAEQTERVREDRLP